MLASGTLLCRRTGLFWDLEASRQGVRDVLEIPGRGLLAAELPVESGV